MLPYLLLCREEAGQREHELRAVFNAVRYMARSGCSWRLIPNDLPPWAAVYQQFRRWLDAGVFEALVSDVQSIVREWAGARANRRRSASTAVRFSPHPSRADVPATTEPRDARDRRCISRLIRWATCWL